MSEQAVFVFDICSSTVVIEELVKSNQVDEYNALMFSIFHFLENRSTRFRFDIYKFQGDGFILLFDEGTLIDHILLFARELYIFSQSALVDFLGECIDIKQLPRIGITMGLDVGLLNSFIMKPVNREYCGRPLNFASRLQSSLSEKDHANKLLMSLKARKEVRTDQLRSFLTERERAFRNMSGESRLRCFEFDPDTLSPDFIDLILEQNPLTRRQLVRDVPQEVFEAQGRLFRKSKANYAKILRLANLQQYAYRKALE